MNKQSEGSRVLCSGVEADLERNIDETEIDEAQVRVRLTRLMPFRAAPATISDPHVDYEDDADALAALDDLEPPLNGTHGSSSDWSIHAVEPNGMSEKAKGKQRAIDLDAEEAGDEDDDAQLRSLNNEIAQIDEQLADLTALRATLLSDRKDLLRKRKKSKEVMREAAPMGKVTDYTAREWEWSTEIKKTAKEVWGIEAFRSMQEAVVNAVMGGRDVRFSPLLYLCSSLTTTYRLCVSCRLARARVCASSCLPSSATARPSSSRALALALVP